MKAEKIEEIQRMIKNHQAAAAPQHRVVPTGAGRNCDDLSKVATNDIIGKGGDPTDVLRK